MRFTPLRTFTALACCLLSLSTAGCSKDNVQTGDEPQTPSESTRPNSSPTQSTHATGSAYLNGIQILPPGTTAVCATHGKVTTMIIGDMPSKSAASVIIDDKGVRALSISDAEDAVEFTDHAIQVEMTTVDGVTTISGEAEGTRVYSGQTQLFPMTFIITASCV